MSVMVLDQESTINRCESDQPAKKMKEEIALQHSGALSSTSISLNFELKSKTSSNKVHLGHEIQFSLALRLENVLQEVPYKHDLHNTVVASANFEERILNELGCFSVLCSPSGSCLNNVGVETQV